MKLDNLKKDEESTREKFYHPRTDAVDALSPIRVHEYTFTL